MTMKSIILKLLPLILLLSACKRNRTCVCGCNYKADCIPYEFKIRDTKENAKQRCHDAPNPYGNISEAPYCEIE